MSELGFYGVIVQPGQSESITPDEGRVVKLSSAALDINSLKKKEAQSAFIVSNGGQEYTVCILTPTAPHAPLDVYFVGGTTVTLINKGNAALHLTGYITFVDAAGSDDEELMMGSDDEEDEEEQEQVRAELKHKTGVAGASAKQAKPAAAGHNKANALPSIGSQLPTDESDDQDDVDGSQGGSEDEDEMMSIGGEGDSDDEESGDEAAAPVKAAPGQQAKKPQQQQGQGQKRKADAPAAAGGEKKAKPASPGKPAQAPAAVSPKKPGAGSPAAAPKQKPQPKAEKPKAAASPAGTIPCSHPGCKKTFKNDSSMQQHAKAAHGAAAAPKAEA